MPKNLYNKEQILNCCLEVFAKNGYKNTSTLMLAEAAGISKALIFHHYKNKKELYLSILNYCIEKTKEEIPEEKLIENSDFFESLIKICRIKFDYIQKSPLMYALLKEAYYTTPSDVKTEIEEKFNPIIADTYKIWWELFEQVKLNNGIDRKEAFELIMVTLEHFRDVFLAETLNNNKNEQYFKKFQNKMNNFINMIRYGITE